LIGKDGGPQTALLIVFQFVLLEFAVERGAIDTEDLRRLGLISVCRIQHFGDIFPFEIAQGKLFRQSLSQNDRRLAIGDDIRRQIFQLYPRSLAQKHRALDRVFELSNVAWPIIILEHGQSLRLDAVHVPLRASGKLLDKMLHQ
jgi:hypothetical protein